MKNIHWVSVLIGILFVLFIWPAITGFIASRKPNTARTA